MKELRSRKEIRKLLSEFRLSEMDAFFTRVCPFYKNGEEEFSTVYRFIHRFVQARLLARLQLRLDRIRVTGETQGENGERVDGIVSEYKVVVKKGKVEIRSQGGNYARDIAVIEVKTGEVGILQPSAYVYKWDLPVIVAEMGTGDVHKVDQQTALKVPSEAIDHMEDIEELKKFNRRIPDYYQCMDCQNYDCEHNGDRDYEPKKTDIIVKKSCIFG